MTGLSYSIVGIDRVELFGKPEKLLNFLELYRIEYMSLKVSRDKIAFSLVSTERLRLTEILEGKKIDFKIVKRRGLPYTLKTLIRRPGIIVGVFIFVVIMLFYGKFVFDIKVVGNDRLSDRYITDALLSEGLTVGSYIPDIDFDEISVAIPGKYGDISWIFVNMMGNVAYAEVREFVRKDENEIINGTITDLVAKSAGQIYRYEISSGICRVGIGETVYAGQKLVSGYGSGGEDHKYSGKSSGKVYAKTSVEKTFTAKCETSEKVTVESELVMKSISFLGKEIKLFEKSGTNNENCDIITREYKLTLLGGAELPVTVREKYAEYYEISELSLSEEDVREEVERQISEYIMSLPDDTVVLSTDRTDVFDGKSYTVIFRIYCIEDIAREVKGSIPEDTAEKNNGN